MAFREEVIVTAICDFCDKIVSQPQSAWLETESYLFRIGVYRGFKNGEQAICCHPCIVKMSQAELDNLIGRTK